MPVAFKERPCEPTLDALRKKWTREECEALVATGAWEDAKYLELIDGELIDKRMGKNESHMFSTLLLFEWLVALFGIRRVRKEDPIDVSPEDNPRSEPEPDISVLRAPIMEKHQTKPSPGDVLLAIEVAASTLSFDLTRKADLYARASIPEYWVLDVKNRKLIVHREPKNGEYASVEMYAEHESIAPLAAPDHEFRVASAF